MATRNILQNTSRYCGPHMNPRIPRSLPQQTYTSLNSRDKLTILVSILVVSALLKYSALLQTSTCFHQSLCCSSLSYIQNQTSIYFLLTSLPLTPSITFLQRNVLCFLDSYDVPSTLRLKHLLEELSQLYYGFLWELSRSLSKSYVGESHLETLI